MRLGRLLALAIAVAVALPAEAGVLDRIRTSGTLNLGYRQDAAPLSYLDEKKEPAGYTVLVCEAVAERLAQDLGVPALKVEWTATTASDGFDAVAAGKIDILCGAATITLTRREKVDFSLPVFVDGAAVMLPKGASTEFDALAGKKIGVHAATTTEASLKATLAAKGMQSEVVAFDSHQAGLAALEDGAIDAYFGDQSILFGLFFESDMSEGLVVSENTLTVEKQGLALPRGDTDFRLAVDRAVSALFTEGKMAAFFAETFRGARPGIGLQALYLLGPDQP